MSIVLVCTMEIIHACMISIVRASTSFKILIHACSMIIVRARIACSRNYPTGHNRAKDQKREKERERERVHTDGASDLFGKVRSGTEKSLNYHSTHRSASARSISKDARGCRGTSMHV